MWWIFLLSVQSNNNICMKERAERNRTLTIKDEEIELLKTLFIDESNVINLDNFENKIIKADLLKVIDNIPDNTADLIIIDPPYNLSKDFNGLKFSARSSDAYLEIQYIKYDKNYS